ncbi:hypothetical protein [uncultured Thiocystis sp.]|uniref:hypothetical protein n=1 Tax=uncultured Thiocystis sp. TaxID=1202134 RepID=UPI0025E8A345|nr:hypothetical protein [uncultured Thiocystis sp.]
MPLTVCLTPEEEALLEAVSRQSARSQDDLVRQGIREICQRLLEQTGPTPYALGQDLFGAGHLANEPTDPAKRQIWEALHAKHRRLG